MTPSSSVALALADAMLAGEASPEGLATRAAWVFEASYLWTPALCAHILERTGDNFHYFSRDELVRIIVECDAFHDAFDPGKTAPQIKRYCLELPLRPEPDAWLSALALPDIPTVGDLARFLNVEIDDLAWFADQWRHRSQSQQPRLQHYHYRWVEKRSGGWRLIEIPKQRLRHMQQTILRKIVDLVPSHGAAHGFRRAHSCLTHAALHTEKRVVVRMDLKNFFPSIPASRIHALFVKLGYSATVAATLARLCVNRTPAIAFAPQEVPWIERQALRASHLPQGSPCSPALANLCAFRLDIRLQALAASMDAVYSRYADDLVFSGGRELERALERFHVQVAAIALEEGFNINTRKTRMMRQGVRQQVTGVVVNSRTNVPRGDFDALKATLTNCARHGAPSQNRGAHPDYRAYLSGRVAWVTMLNPAKGARLHKLLSAIVWFEEPSAILRPSGQGSPT